MRITSALLLAMLALSRVGTAVAVDKGLFSNVPGAQPSEPSPFLEPRALPSNIDRAMTEAREAEEAARIKKNTRFTDLIGAAAADGSIGFIDRTYSESKVRSKPGSPPFIVTDDHLKKLREQGIDEEQWDLFTRATNQEHFDYLTGIARENMVGKETRAQFGMLANIAAGALDPSIMAALMGFLFAGGLGFIFGGPGKKNIELEITPAPDRSG